MMNYKISAEGQNKIHTPRQNQNYVTCTSPPQRTRAFPSILEGLPSDWPEVKRTSFRTRRPKMSSKPATAEHFDVIVVGGGVSGLTAASVLHRDFHADVLVLEARERVGGRTATLKDSRGCYCDVGGAYICKTQHRILSLAENLGISTYKVYSGGDSVELYLGKRVTKQGALASFGSFLGALDINNFWQLIDKMAKEVPLKTPWLAPKAREWDQMTFQEFINQNCWTNYGKAVAKTYVQGMLTSEPHDISLLHFLWYLHSGGGVRRNIELEAGGGQEMKFLGGSQQISNKMAENLGERVKLSSYVSSIDQTEDQFVKVSCYDGNEYKAKYVICSVPPTLLGKIRFQPPLSALKSQMTQRIPMGCVIKTVMYYEKAFWKEKGLSGYFNTDTGPIEEGYDDTKPDGSFPAIMGFLLANQARELTDLSMEERKKLICAQYATIYDSQEALEPVHYVEKNWMEDEFAGGCYVGVCPPGVLTTCGKVLRQPFDRVHFCGTMTATMWAGYIEGAVEAGERAAVEILQRLGKIREEETDARLTPDNATSEFMEFSFTEKYLMPSVPTFLASCTVFGALTVVSVIAFKFWQK